MERTEPPGRLPHPRPAGLAAVALSAALLAACASGAGRVSLPDPGAGACGPGGDGGGEVPGTLTVVADGPADPVRLPHAGSLAERLLVRHLYRSLVRVGCRGRLVPDLAESWRREEDGRRWRFRLEDAAAPDGDPITARTVVASWREARVSLPSGSPSPLAGITAEAEGPRTLVVTSRTPLASPAAFARPAFAVVGGPAGGGWPGATGPYRTDGLGGSATALPRGDGGLVLRPAGSRGGPMLRVAPADPGRARDLIDEDADVVVTRDPGLLAYADAREALDVRPLPWDRTYLLLVPPGAGPVPSVGGPGAAREIDDRLRRSLARFAVRGAARPAPDEGWWSGARCPAGSSPAAGVRPPAPGAGGEAGSPPAGRSRVLIHPGSDQAAADLAGRLVALAGPGDGAGGPGASAGAPTRTGPRTRASFRRSLRAGGAAGYVLPVLHRVLDPCLARAGLRERVPWLRRPGARLVPLVTTRAGLAVRRGLTELRPDWDGIPRLDGVLRQVRP